MDGRAGSFVPIITDLDTLQNFVQYMVRYTPEELINMVFRRILEASVFVSLDVSDLTSSASIGVTMFLMMDGDLVEDVLHYITGKILEIVLRTDNFYFIDPVGMFVENIDLEVTIYTGIWLPRILSDSMDLPHVNLGFIFRTNLAGIIRILGTDIG